MIPVLGFGDNVVDVYLHQGKMYPGGNALNFAVLASKLGYQSAYMGIFGDDRAAGHIYHSAKKIGLDLSHCRFASGPSGLCKVNLVYGDRRFVYSNHGGISTQIPFSLTELDYQYMQGFRLVHTSVFSRTDELLPGLKQRGLCLSYDFSDKITPELADRVSPYLFCACLSASHLAPQELCQWADRLQSAGCPMVLATCGEQGAVLFYRGEAFRQSACRIQAVDTMAAGDSFITAFLVRYMDGMAFSADFPDGTEGLVTVHDYETALIRTSLSAAAVFAAENCGCCGSFGFGTEYQE